MMAGGRGSSTEETQKFICCLLFPALLPVILVNGLGFLAFHKDYADEPDGLFLGRFFQSIHPNAAGFLIFFFHLSKNLYSSCVS